MTWLFSFVRASFWRPVALAVLAVLVAMQIGAAAPSYSISLNSILNVLAIFAGTAIGSFILAVGLDIIFGIALAFKQHTFDPHKLGSFLESQLGTQRAAALLGLVAAAVMTAIASALVNGGITQQALQGVADAALAAATAGASAMLVSVLADILSKFSQLTGAPAPPLK